jgi:hypothetical protein
MKDVSQEVVEQWFELFARTVDENKILNKNIYNMDEIGFAIGTIESM